MEPLSKKIQVTKTARYFILGKPSPNIQSIWFACHGYGQSAYEFLEKISSIHNPKNIIVAPEGFHRFYRKGFSGDVGASWMTKEERLDDINDYVNFLDAVYEEVTREAEKLKINVFGFSQGTATVCRWLARGKVNAEKLILWGGGVPPDVSEIEREKLNRIKPVIVIGDSDEFISNKTRDEQLKYLAEKKIQFKFIPYDGKHEIREDVLRKVCGE